MVEVEGSAQSGTGLHDAGGVVVVGRSRIFGQKLATKALVIAFGIVVSDVFTNKMSQVSFTKDDKVIEAFISDGLDEALGVRVAVGALRRDRDAADAAAG